MKGNTGDLVKEIVNVIAFAAIVVTASAGKRSAVSTGIDNQGLSLGRTAAPQIDPVFAFTNKNIIIIWTGNN
jgi:hypothetical protein